MVAWEQGGCFRDTAHDSRILFFFPDKFQIHPLPLSFIEMGKLADPCRMMSKDELRGALLPQPAKHVEHFRKQH